ncbi:MAG: hypothetical protein PGN16_02180 [Sphingomonas phyllosphaerae]|uniref:hypothetical protein n=1 Tax=Sphingomonas phyllosphaerae TaxID=257003 RepID=UPI002FFA4199
MLDLENQIARNAAYEYDLEEAGESLRAQSLYWNLATAFCLSVAVALAVVAFARLRSEYPSIRDYVGLTIFTTTIALLSAAAAACFVHFMALRRLASEAFRINRINRHMVTDAREFMEKLR